MQPSSRSRSRAAGLQGLPLEGLWWAEDLSTFLTGDKSEWDWTMMLRQPDAVTDALFARLADDVAAKKSIPAARELRLITFEEGAAAQVLHVGPYATEAPTIVRLHQFIQDQGFAFDGHRHKTTRSTSATHAGRLRTGCAPSSDSRTPRRDWVKAGGLHQRRSHLPRTARSLSSQWASTALRRCP